MTTNSNLLDAATQSPEDATPLDATTDNATRGDTAIRDTTTGDSATIDPPVRLADGESPASAPDHFLLIRPSSGWSALRLSEVWQFRDLLFSLASRDLKLRYKQTALGVIWVILQPLLAAGVFSFVFGMVAKLPSEGLPYFVFSYAGLLGWNLFAGTLSKSSGCLLGNAQLISKIYFPRLLLPLSSIPSILVDFTVALSMMAVLMLIYHIPLTPGILLLPVLMVVLLLIAMGVGLCAAALAISYRDVLYILPVATQLLMYASPIAYGLNYAMERVPPRFRIFYLLNPVSTPLEAFRAALLGTHWPPIHWLFYSGAMSILIFVLGAFSFKRMERKFADVI